MELYVNGNRAGADIYDNSYYFRQDTPAGITVDSASADVELKNIRIYNRALSDDEVLDNRMVDAGSSDDMMRLYEENDILGGSGDVDIDKLRAKGKGVMRIVRKGGLDEVNETNNKKTDFIADVYFWSLSARSTTSSSVIATSGSRVPVPRNTRARTYAFTSPRAARTSVSRSTVPRTPLAATGT